MPARAFSRRLTSTFFVPLVGIVLLGTALLLWRFSAETSAADWVQHSNQVIIGAKDAEIDLRAMQVNWRSALLFGDAQYRDRVEKAQRALAETLTPDRDQRLERPLGGAGRRTAALAGALAR
jgi:CHASE3 domain sensor protein